MEREYKEEFARIEQEQEEQALISKMEAEKRLMENNKVNPVKKVNENNKTMSVEEIKEKITTDQKWLERAIIAIYNYQTSDEQYEEDVKYNNNVGFTGADSKYFSYCAKWLLNDKHLSGKFIEKGFIRIAKYARQLKRIIDHKQDERDVNVSKRYSRRIR